MKSLEWATFIIRTLCIADIKAGMYVLSIYIYIERERGHYKRKFQPRYSPSILRATKLNGNAGDADS